MSMQDVAEKAKRNAPRISFKKAKRNKQGDLVLRRRILLPIPFISLFALMVTGLVLTVVTSPDLSANETLVFIALFLSSAFLFGFIAIVFLVSKTVIEAEGVASYRISGKKYIKFNSITAVDFTSLYLGGVLLKGKGIKIFVPMNARGFMEFYEILKNKVQIENLQKCLFEDNMELPQYYDNVEEKRNGFTVTRQGKQEIIGIRNMSYAQLMFQIQKGEKFVAFRYSLFLLVFNTQGYSPIYFGEKSTSATFAKIKYIILSSLILIVPIEILIITTHGHLSFSALNRNTIGTILLLLLFSTAPISSIITNLKGGVDVTDVMVDYIKTKLDLNEMDC